MLINYLKKNLCILTVLALAIAPFSANATFIDFDDILALPGSPFACSDDAPCGTRLHKEYEDKGIIFYSAWLRSDEWPPVDYKNEVVALHEMLIEFNGELPNFVSFNVDSALGHEASFFHVYDETDQLLFVQRSNGWVDDEALDTPYTPNQFITITSQTPIKAINFSSFQNTRNGPVIDNLTFEYRPLSVDEPSNLLLVLSGLFGLMIFRNRLINNTLH